MENLLFLGVPILKHITVQGSRKIYLVSSFNILYYMLYCKLFVRSDYPQMLIIYSVAFEIVLYIVICYNCRIDTDFPYQEYV